jgi:shikimate 5-dehydrogenase
MYNVYMRVIALMSQQPQIQSVLDKLDDPEVVLFPVTNNKPLTSLLTSMATLEFAGALVLDSQQQIGCLPYMQRSSLDAQQAGAVDIITITPAGLFGDYALGHAMGALLKSAGYHLHGARVVLLGSGTEVSAIARELSSLGIQHLSILAANRPEAEKALPQLAASTTAISMAVGEPMAATYIEQADLLIRVDYNLSVADSLLGPHLSVIDFSPLAMSPLRQGAMKAGAKTLGLRDVQAHQLSLALGRLLGKPFKADVFLNLLHQ